MVWENNRERGKDKNVVSAANFLDWQEQNDSFEQMAGLFDFRFNLTGGDSPEELVGQLVTANFFDLLGATATAGRTFVPEEGEQGKDDVAILSYGLWQRRFGGDPSIVGQNITLNGQSTAVVGIMPRNVPFYIKKGSMVGKQPDLWLPMTFGPNARVRQGRYLLSIARLKPDVTIERAQSQMDALARSYEEQYPDFNKGWGVTVAPLSDELVGDIRPALMVLLGAVGFVLLIACANVANLLLARAASRQKEIAIRTAMGAPRSRIVRQLLTESCLLALIGGTFGVFLALWGVDLLLALSPKDLVRTQGVGVNFKVLGFAAAVSVITGIVFGVVPAFEASRPELNESLKEGGRSGASGARGNRMRSIFVIAQVAMALVLLICSGLMIKSLGRLQSVDPGFDARNLLTVKLQLPGSRYREDQKQIAFFRELINRIETLPGVRSAGAINYLPFAGPGAGTGFTIEGEPEPPPSQRPVVDARVAEPGYFDTMRIPFVAGRNFNEREATQESHVVVINETMARLAFSDADPLGRKVTIFMKGTNVPSTIIGVVGDVKHESLSSEVRAMAYWPPPEQSYRYMTVVVRTESSPTALVPAIRNEVLAMDRDQPISDAVSMEELLGSSVSKSRFSALLLSIFAGLALVLASVGIYGVMSYSVTQRSHEIGIRMALGAQRRDVVRMVVVHGMLLSLAGIAVGLVGSFALTRLLGGLLYGVSSTDPVTFAAISATLVLVALAACFIPARRASRVDPMVSLRYE
jgi:putative ABC transport system permease protein